MVFGEIESFLSVTDRLGRFLARKTTASEETIAQRLVKLFQAHGVHRNQIPRLLMDSLSLADVSRDESLTAALTEDLLATTCELFAVNRDWLDGASDTIYPLHDFYKSPREFITFVQSIKERSLTTPMAVLLRSRSNKHEEDAVLIIEEGVAWLNDKPLYRYHLCPNWMLCYWKSRAYLTACIAIARNEHVHVMGREVSIDVIRRHVDGTTLLTYQHDSALPTQGRHWEPEDMALRPEAFLEGVDPETDNFGLKSGLELWLRLHDEGLMETGLPYPDVGAVFQARLAELS